MTLAALNLLAMGGGQAPIDIDGNTVFVKYQDYILHVRRGVHNFMAIYVDKSGTKRVSVNYSQWLPSGVSVSTSTWSVEDSSTLVTLANAASDSTTAEVYVTATTRDTETFIKNVMLTDATIPETITISILIKCVRVAG